MMIDETPNFPFIEGMPRAQKKETPKSKLAALVNSLVEDGFTTRQIALSISERLSPRTVEAWVQDRKLPKEWVCELVIKNHRKDVDATR